MKRLPIWLTVVFFVTSALQAQLKPEPQQFHNDGVLAIVNDQLMTIFDVTSETKLGENRIQMKYSVDDLAVASKRKALEEEIIRLRSSIAHNMVEQELIYAEFVRNSFSLPTSMVDGRVNKTVQRYAKGDIELFKKQLASAAITLEEFRERTEKRIAVEMLLESWVFSKIKVLPARVQDYYQANLAKYTTETRIRLQLLELHSDKLADGLDGTADEIDGKIKNGVDFNTLVQQYSHGSRKEGGLRPWEKLKSIHSSLRDFIRDLPKGKCSKRIKLGGNYYWLYVKDREDGGIRPLTEVRTEIMQTLTANEREGRYQRFLRKLRAKSYLKKYFE